MTSANYSSSPKPKPHDGDDLAVKVNQPNSTALDDYSDPDATIAAICGQSFSRESLPVCNAIGPAGCEKRFEHKFVDRGPVHSSDESLSPRNGHL